MGDTSAGQTPRNRRRNDDRGEWLSSLTVEGNPHARRAYCFSLVGLIPVLGLVLGVFAVYFGILGRRASCSDPARRGHSHSNFAITLGAIEIVVNAVGLTFVAIGLQWI